MNSKCNLIRSRLIESLLLPLHHYFFDLESNSAASMFKCSYSNCNRTFTDCSICCRHKNNKNLPKLHEKLLVKHPFRSPAVLAAAKTVNARCHYE